VVGRGELTDKAWAQLAPLLPRNQRRGGRWRDHRTVVNGILWKLRTGAPWRDLPERYGPWTTCHDRLVRWRRDGTWDRLLAHAQTKSDAVGELEWVVCVDSSSVRAHQHAAGARKRAARSDLKRGRARPGRGARPVPGRADHQGAPQLRRPRTAVERGPHPGQRHDSTQLEPVLEAIAVPRPSGPGRPRKRPDHLVGDKGYSYPRCRDCCAVVASPTPSPSGPTSAPAVPAGRVGRWPSTVSATGAVMW
jgi:transposase